MIGKKAAAKNETTMEYEAQLKLQAYLDGELPESEARETANRLAKEPEAEALLAELKGMRQVLAGFETAVKLPETREFYWSKIEREIQRGDAPAAESVELPFLLRLRRLLVPASGMAALVVAVCFGLRLTPDSSSAEMQTAMSDPDSITYQDYDTGATVVWFSYPAENEVAKN